MSKLVFSARGKYRVGESDAIDSAEKRLGHLITSFPASKKCLHAALHGFCLLLFKISGITRGANLFT